MSPILRQGLNFYAGNRYRWLGTWSESTPPGDYHIGDSVMDQNEVERFYHLCSHCGDGYWSPTYVIVSIMTPPAACPRCVPPIPWA